MLLQDRCRSAIIFQLHEKGRGWSAAYGKSESLKSVIRKLKKAESVSFPAVLLLGKSALL